MNRIRRFAFYGLVLGIVFSVGFLLGNKGETQATLLLSGPESIPKGVDLDPVWKAWRLLDDKFVPANADTVVNSQNRIWGIIKGLANSYGDPYTVFLPPQESKSFGEEISGSFGGVGVEIGIRDDILTVIAPLKGTPAEIAGIMAGDLIVEVDGVSTKNMTIDDAISAIRGEVGTEVVFTVAREGENEFIFITIERGIIEVPTLEHEVIDGDVFNISLYNFGGTAVREMRTALRKFELGNYSKLIIDLRGNPGGYLSSAVEMASWFLPIGKIVVTEDFGKDQEDIIHRSKGQNVSKNNWKIVVLIDGGSASASEILAGALREHNKATLIGEQTFGKGSVQELVEVTPDTSLKITVARWLTPNGVSISESGLTPDFVVERTREDIDKKRDPQKESAVHFLKTGQLLQPQNLSGFGTSSVLLEAT